MDDSKMNKFLKKGDIKFSKSKDQIWEEVFSKKMTSNKQESKMFSLHSFFPQKRFSYAVAATVLVLLGVAYFNYEDNSLASEEAEVVYKISKEEFAEIEFYHFLNLYSRRMKLTIFLTCMLQIKL